MIIIEDDFMENVETHLRDACNVSNAGTMDQLRPRVAAPC